MTAGASDRAAPPHVGQIVDRRYVLKRPISHGEVYDVFEAEHGWTQVRVALKALVDPRHAPRPLRARLLREARVLGICMHPSLPMVLDAGDCEDAGPYVVTEFLEGRALHSILLVRERLDVPTSLAIAAQLGQALDHVHRRNVVHRDVKPSNVIITPGRDSTGDRVRLIDFGVAAVAPEADANQERVTQHGQIVGTRAYMSPEQLLGLSGVDARRDVFSLAVLLYECLTGVLPFPSSASEWMRSFATGLEPAPMPASDHAIPAALEYAVRRGMAYDPSNRPASASEFVEACIAAAGLTIPALDLYGCRELDGGPIGDPRSPSSERNGREARRRYVRAPFTGPARLLRSDGTHVDGRVEDVSEGGMLLVAEAGCAEGEHVVLRAPLPVCGKVVDFDAVARWTRRGSGQRAIGLEFLSPPSDALTDIRKYVELMSS